MAIDGSAVIGLAQTGIAVSMAYVALDRFRYRAEISAMYAEACDMIGEQYRHDYAWVNIECLARGDASETWPEAPVAHRLYKSLFVDGWDRRICIALAGLALAVMIGQAFIALLFNHPVGELLTSDPQPWHVYAHVSALSVLVLAIVAPLTFFLCGRRVIAVARRLMKKWLEYLAGKARAEDIQALDEKMRAADVKLH